MKTLPREPAFELLDQWWNDMREEWFKVEVLQNYYGEDKGPSLDAWLAGDEEKSIGLMSKLDKRTEAWISSLRKSPAVKRRFHVVETPYTPYVEWEIELYKNFNIPLGGEIVHSVPAEKVKHLNIPNGDVMIFDRKRVARNHYNAEGFCESIDFYDVNEADDISPFLKLREELPKYSVKISVHAPHS